MWHRPPVSSVEAEDACTALLEKQHMERGGMPPLAQAVHQLQRIARTSDRKTPWRAQLLIFLPIDNAWSENWYVCRYATTYVDLV